VSPNKDRTGNERQRRRREREKVWLKEHGFESWEALHTELLSGRARLTPRAADGYAASQQSRLFAVGDEPAKVSGAKRRR